MTVARRKSLKKSKASRKSVKRSSKRSSKRSFKKSVKRSAKKSNRGAKRRKSTKTYTRRTVYPSPPVSPGYQAPSVPVYAQPKIDSNIALPRVSSIAQPTYVPKQQSSIPPPPPPPLPPPPPPLPSEEIPVVTQMTPSTTMLPSSTQSSTTPAFTDTPQPKKLQRSMSIAFGAPVERIGMQMDSLFSELLAKTTMNYIATLATNVQQAHPISSIRLYKIAIQRCIRYYTGAGYREMNSYLLSRPSKFAGPSYQTGGKKHHAAAPPPAYIPVPDYAITVICVRVLNFMTSSCRLKSPLIVYRGLRDMRARDISAMSTREEAFDVLTTIPRPGGTPIPFVGQQMQIGAIFSNPSFMSTSLDRNVSERFRSGWGSSSSDVAQNCCLFQLTLPAGFPCLYLEPFSVVKTEHELLVSPCCQFVVTAADRNEQVYKLKPLEEPTDGYTEYLNHLNKVIGDETQTTADEFYAEIGKDLIMLNTLFDAVWSVRTSANRYEDVAQCICAKKCDIVEAQDRTLGRTVQTLKSAPEAYKALNRVIAVSKLHPYFVQQVTQEVRNLAYDFEDNVRSEEELVRKAMLILEKLDHAADKLADLVRTEHNMTVIIFFMELLEREWYFSSDDLKIESERSLERCYTIVKDMLEDTPKPPAGFASWIFGKK